MSGSRFGLGMGGHIEDAWKSIIDRTQARRARLAHQTWKDFFKGLAIETAVIAAIVIVVAAVILLVR